MINLFSKNLGLIATTSLILTIPVVCNAEAELLSVSLNSSRYFKMESNISRIAVGSSEIATVIQLPSSKNEFLVVAHKSGSTSLFVWLSNGTMREFLINVSPEDIGKAKLIERAIDLPYVHVKFVNNRVLLTGMVQNQYERNYALQTARLYVGNSGSTSLSVGSNVEMSLDTSSAVSRNNSSEDLDLSKVEDQGNIIDLLQVLHPTQIKLEAQIIEVNSDSAKDLGIQYGANGTGNIFTFGENHDRTSTTEIVRYVDNEGIPRTMEVETGSDIEQFAKQPLKWLQHRFGPINATIHALVSKGKAKVLSRPNITTMSGEQATIQIGGQIPYATSNVNGTTLHFKDYGIILQFKPIVDAQNRITSVIHTEVSNIGGQSVDGQPVIATRRADSVITLNSGSTIVIGGLMDSSETKSVSKIPLLGDIPILGELFKYNSKHRDKRELIILVTPYLVEENDMSRAQMSDPMQDLYNNGVQEKNSMNEVDLNNSAVDEN